MHGPAAVLLSLFVAVGTAAAESTLELNILGVDKELSRNFRLHLGELPSSVLDDTEALRAKLEKTLDAALQPFGHYSASIETELSGQELTIHVNPGPVVLFNAPDLRVEGEAATLPAVSTLLQNPPIQAGTPLRHRTYDETKESLLQLVRDHGFLDARYQRTRLKVNLETGRATALLWLDSGPRFHFGAVHFDHSRIDDDVLERINRVETGEPFDRTPVTQLTRQLQDTGYFARVDVSNAITDPNLVDLHVNLDDAKRHRYDLGVGFSTDSNLRTRLGWIQPAVNSRGHSLRSELFLSNPRKQVSVGYRIPGAHPLNDSINLSLGFEEREIKSSPVETGVLGAHYTTLGSSDWQRTWGGSLNYEDYDVSEDDRGDLLYLAPDINFTRLRITTGMDPSNGMRISLGAEGSTETLGADTDYLRLYGLSRWLWRIPKTTTNLLARGELGTIVTDEIDQVPLTRRFFTGGDQSVRGYGYETISPRDEDGNRSGGKHLVVGSLEATWLVRPTWRLALFGDVGRAFTDSDERWRRSLGIGVRWLTPFGQLRVDVAAPLNDSDADTVRLHFSLGASL